MINDPIPANSGVLSGVSAAKTTAPIGKNTLPAMRVRRRKQSQYVCYALYETLLAHWWLWLVFILFA
uniref:hypothetical protein n=1 Tax=Paraburkholderia sp. RL17-373-BIF-A TaxID=3031629 RepID=UPI0038BD374C